MSKDNGKFILKDIDIKSIDIKYNFNLVSNINICNNPINITRISEITTEKPKIISFLDQGKLKHICNISFIDFKTNNQPNSVNCYWCRNYFNGDLLGCPIKYIPNQGVKKYNSKISKDIYTIKQDVLLSEFNHKKCDNITIENKDIYKTDGVFCSFNCIKAYIDDNKHNILYNNSNVLLYKMYRDITGTEIKKIERAPHWRILKEYGGHLTINEFRESFNEKEYNYQGLIHSIGTLWESNTYLC